MENWRAVISNKALLLCAAVGMGTRSNATLLEVNAAFLPVALLKIMRVLNNNAFIALAMKLGTATAAFVNYQRLYNLKTPLFGAPEEALPDIVIPNIFSFAEDSPASFIDEDTRLWVPQSNCLSFRPLCLCVSQGYYVNLLKFKGGGMLSRHRHSSPVHALTIKGKWRCKHTEILIHF